MSTTMKFTPQHSSPLARTTSPFQEPRPAPCTPGNTAQIWDEYERRAVENVRRRDTAWSTSRRQTQQSRFSSGTVLDIIKSYDSHPSKISLMKGSPQFDFGFPTQQFSRLSIAKSTTLATCKTCKEPITSALGICEACKKTIIISARGEATPPSTPTAKSFTSNMLSAVQNASPPRSTASTSASPKRKPHRSASAQLVDPPIRLSSLRPPPSSQNTPHTSAEASRSRKSSLPGSLDITPRLHISRKPVPAPAPAPTSHPPTPTTPPSTSHSQPPTTEPRPSSLATLTTPPTIATPVHRSTRHTSATPSELSTLYPYLTNSTPTTSPPSVCRASYQLQNTMSAWEDSDSEDEEKVGLVKYWRGRRWRGSRGSLGGQSGLGRRESAGTGTGIGHDEEGRKVEGDGRRKRRFVRVISCGYNGE